MTISTGAEKAFYRIQQSDMINTHSKAGLEKELLNLIKGISENPNN